MKVFDNYSQYRRERNRYAAWKNEKNIQEAKRLAYIKKNNITPKDRHSDIQRAEAILNCIDVMDEYSQTRSEDMEIVTEQAKAIISEVGMFTSVGLGLLYFKLSKSANNIIDEIKKGNYKSVHKLILPAFVISIPMFASMIVGSVWGAGKEIKASQIGRAEAINTRLNSPKQFAELTDEQEKKVEEIANTIKLSPKEAKKLSNANKGLGIFKSIKTIFASYTKELSTIHNISQIIYKDRQLFDEVKLTDKEIEEAKKDKQLIQNVVEKIDIASQDYAEDVELATGVISTAALAGGALTGWITNKILSKIPSATKHSKLISIFVALALGISLAAPSAKVQKQASRVGRFKVKQDFLNNPEKLIYINDDDAKNENETNFLNSRKKPNFFQFMINIFKENKEYNQYLKTEYVKSQKRSMAREQIQLTPEQEKRAKQLQLNTFKMFNKLDEKSQSFSESVEAVGEIFTNSITSAIELLGFAATWLLVQRRNSAGNGKKLKILSYLPALAALAVAVPLSIYITKEQKRASKVANMLAIKDLDDYRNFADYTDKENILSQSKVN